MTNKDIKAFEWLDENQLSYDIWDKKYRINNESFDEWLDRVSDNSSEIRRLIYEKKFSFAGRTLANRNGRKGSYSNCYSHGFIEDSLDEILEANKNIALTYKAQGGEGLSLSKLRPKGTPIGGEYLSDGIIPFMKMYNTTTESISQGGARKGALLISLDITHKDAVDFITVKSNHDAINKANLSVEIDDEFMRYVEEYYTTGNRKVMHIKRDYSGNVVEYDIYPIDIYKLLCKNAKENAEPGVIYTNMFRNYNIMEYVDDYQIETCNPCGEQPLIKHGACNLCSINLSKYVLNPFTKNARIDYNELSLDINYIVEAMDEIIDHNADNHALKEQKEASLKYRNIGIGIMGLADMFCMLGVKYGSSDSLGIASVLMKFIFKEAVLSSVVLAKYKGNFPGYDPKVWDSTIMKDCFEEYELEELKKKGKLRNCSLTSIAPTGSIGTYLNISTGVEPFFMLKYFRKTESLSSKDSYYEVMIKCAEDYIKATGNTELPDYFVTSADINYIDRIKMQSVLQKWVDTAISSTINLPSTTTLETVETIFLEAWKHKLKGVTIYVDGSRAPILSSSVTNTQTTYKRPKTLEADYYQIKIKGEQFIVLVGLLDNKPYEIFTFRPTEAVNIEKHRGVIIKNKKRCYQFNSDFINITDLQLANTLIEENAATLYTSMLLRHNVDIEHIIKTAKKVNENITSFSSAMCRILSKYLPDGEVKDTCPDCGNIMIREGGCVGCKNCGYSKC